MKSSKYWGFSNFKINAMEVLKISFRDLPTHGSLAYHDFAALAAAFTVSKRYFQKFLSLINL